MKIISIQGKIFKQFRNTKYYCDENGNIYSDYSHKILSPMLRGNGDKKYYSIDINFGAGQKHYPVHKIVYETWIGPLEEGKSILHKDDNSLNNNFNNLYLSTQRENIQDCIINNHRVGNIWVLTVYDKLIDETLTFCPASDFIEYSNHTCANKNVSRMFTRNWFKERYNIIDYYRCKNRNEKEGVTTMSDECNSVGLILSQSEAHDTCNACEEIV